VPPRGRISPRCPEVDHRAVTAVGCHATQPGLDPKSKYSAGPRQLWHARSRAERSRYPPPPPTSGASAWCAGPPASCPAGELQQVELTRRRARASAGPRSQSCSPAAHGQSRTVGCCARLRRAAPGRVGAQRPSARVVRSGPRVGDQLPCLSRATWRSGLGHL